MKSKLWSLLLVPAIVAVVILLPRAELGAASDTPISALPDGITANSTDLIEVSRNVFTSPDERWRSFSLQVADLNTRTSQQYHVSGRAKAGATAGWVVGAGANLFEWTLPASQTASTLVIPVDGLKVGWTITAFGLNCQIESAGGTVTLDAALRSLTNLAADPTDASVGAITQVSVTADTKSEPQKTGLADVVEADERFYILVTGTTAASTDVRCLNANVTVTEA